MSLDDFMNEVSPQKPLPFFGGDEPVEIIGSRSVAIKQLMDSLVKGAIRNDWSPYSIKLRNETATSFEVSANNDRTGQKLYRKWVREILPDGRYLWKATV